MTSYERRVKRLHDHVMANEKKATDNNKPTEPTNKELMAMLDELGIEYDKKATKLALLELLEMAKEDDEGAE